MVLFRRSGNGSQASALHHSLCPFSSSPMVLSGGVVGTETGSMRWMGDGSTLSMEIVIGWENGEDSRLAVPFSPI
ncbi:hypothetical protein F2Q69_00047883 [Brassica cretica]|uniref:Uncharacterized protein n=1 Tax=Brassica cretica TaxID=69181 RepID=A0A8S9Q586_BRACR|nr:hypothetical protein F2Q69_00047883 [Brassica cretica]